MKYRVYLQTVASCSVEVEADNEDDAIDTAIDVAPHQLCYHCETSRNGSIGVELSGEWEPSDDAVEPA